MTVLTFERYPVDPESCAEFEAAVEEAIESMRSAPGALWADHARAADDDPSYVVLAEWRTPADAAAWQTSPEAAAFNEAADLLLRGEPTRRRFTGV